MWYFSDVWSESCPCVRPQARCGGWKMKTRQTWLRVLATRGCALSHRSHISGGGRRTWGKASRLTITWERRSLNPPSRRGGASPIPKSNWRGSLWVVLCPNLASLKRQFTWKWAFGYYLLTSCCSKSLCGYLFLWNSKGFLCWSAQKSFLMQTGSRTWN